MDLLSQVPEPTAKILDLGGTVDFWEKWGFAGSDRLHVTVVNLKPQTQRYENVVPVTGDATSIDREDNTFDISFSNSTIEHVGRSNRESMASEARRLAPRYFIQTPNFWFPIEPHFLFPGWQYLPRGVQERLIRHRSFGHIAKAGSREEARETIEHRQLLTARQMCQLFPDGHLLRERFGPLTKSLTMVRPAPSP